VFLAMGLLGVIASPTWGQPATRLEVPTVRQGGTLWVALREAGRALGYQVHYRPKENRVDASRGDRRTFSWLTGGQVWRTADQRLLVPVRWLQPLGYHVSWQPDPGRVLIRWEGQTGYLPHYPKRIAVNLGRQKLRAHEGEVLVYHLTTSTGRLGYRTPSGEYAVKTKERMHISSIYPEPTGGAEMPYAMRFYGGYFIHGHHHVPGRPVSHGCIRLEIPQAKRLYEWTPLGTPVRIYRSARD
jgi:hypothetical protein